MMSKPLLALIIVTLLTILVHLYYIFIENNSNLSLSFSLFNISNFDICSLCCSAVLFLSITTLLKLYITSLIDDNWTLSRSLQDFYNDYKIVGVGLGGLISVFLMNHVIEISHEEKIRCFLVTIYTSIISVGWLTMIKGYDDVDYAESQNSDCSIGAYWATGSVMAYYEKSLKRCRERLENFEENNPKVKFLVKKVVLVCPLSCNIEGSLKERCPESNYIGDLEPIECDQGANYNRRLKTSVYEIYRNRGIFVAAEFPSPLGTLWGERHTMDKKVRLYHRDCFLKELKEQLLQWSYPVLILEYDDQNSSTAVPLHHFIVNSLQNHLEENNHYL